MEVHISAVADPRVYKGTPDSINEWTDEGFTIAKDLYDGLEEDKAVPKEYLEKWTPVAYERLLLGGYRLASLLEYIFSDKVADDAMEQAIPPI